MAATGSRLADGERLIAASGSVGIIRSRSLRVEAEPAEVRDPAGPAALQVQHHADCAHRLPSDRARAEPGQRTERLDPRRDVEQGIGVERAGAAIVARVEGGEQLSDLAAAALAEHEPIRPHPQRLPHQPVQSHRAGALEIGLARLQGDEMGMVDPQFRDILDRHDAVGRIGQAEQRGQQRRLAAAAGPGDEDVLPGGDEGGQGLGRHGLEEAGGGEIGDAQPLHPGQANRQQGAGRRDRRQHRVHPDAVLQPDIDTR